MRGGPRLFLQGFPCLAVLWILPRLSVLRLRGSHPLWPVFPEPFRCTSRSLPQSEPRSDAHSGLGSSRFARRYFGNHFCFLFLRLLRCFSSPGSPPRAMDSRADTRVFPAWVPPFRHLRFFAYVPLPAAFRSLSRLSSAPSAKASALRPFWLDPSPRPPSVAAGVLFFLFFLFDVFVSVFGFQGTTAVSFPPSGLKWTRTTDLTLIRRAL